MLFQLLRDDVLTYLLFNNICSILIDLNHAVYRTVDVILKHIAD